VAETAALSRRVLRFFARLREDCGFSTGGREARDALRALRAIGVADPARVRAALRTVACKAPEQIVIFESRYELWFLGAEEGTAQSAYAPRHTRRSPNPATEADEREPKPGASGAQSAPDRDAGSKAPGALRDARDAGSPAQAWTKLRARYSPQAARSAPPAVSASEIEPMLSAARRLVRSIRLGRARRWKPHPRGTRFDVRRTLRAGLQTGGDPVELHRLGPPRRAPGVVVLIDGSRSMTEHAPVLLQFAFALRRASRRARAYAFSTELLDVSRMLDAVAPGESLPELGEAWGGGTRVGASLERFVREYGARVLGTNTLVVIASDGLDAGDTVRITRAMREIRRRCAGIVWVNPHARAPGFEPLAGGMRAALPYVDALDELRDAGDVVRIAARVMRRAIVA
jgi:uncharacterized protein